MWARCVRCGVSIIVIQLVFMIALHNRFGRFSSEPSMLGTTPAYMSELNNQTLSGHESSISVQRPAENRSMVLNKEHRDAEAQEGHVVLPRVFRSWESSHSELCQKGFQSPEKEAANKQKHNRTGLLFQKTFKTASSSASGVNLRIARSIASRLERNFTFCESGFTHIKAALKYSNRNKKHSFLWTILREPTSRATSHFFHIEVSRKKRSPNDENFKEYCLSNNDRYLTELTLSGYHRKIPNRSVEAVSAVERILNEYDFIAITERFDESLVVLQMLLDVSIYDILYLKAKSQGGYDDGGGAGGICTFIVPSFVSKGMAAWFKSSEWEDVIRYDKMLYESANQSLDLTIDMLGRENVQQNVERFRHIQKSALEHCLKEAIFPCNSRGERVNTTNCLWIDSGCGTQCLDNLSTKIESRNTTRRS